MMGQDGDMTGRVARRTFLAGVGYSIQQDRSAGLAAIAWPERRFPA